jgi:hypothetical protein
MNKKKEFTPRFDFSEIIGNKTIISSSVGQNGEAVVLAVEKKFAKEPFGRNEQKFGSFPLSKPKHSYPAVFIRCDGELIQQTELADVEIAYPFIQPLPAGEILVVGGRCDFRNGNPEQNAAVYGPDGALRRKFVLGDGINCVQATADGMIWVSYFDEGVFGNFGWKKPMGAAGLICFDRFGRIEWQYQPPVGFDIIVDCYSLNVCADSVWACYYTDFPVVRIDSRKQVYAWKNTVAGASALAVSSDHVLLWGGYGEKRTTCILQNIRGDSLTDPVELCLTFPSGLNALGATFIGRGSVLHAFFERSWSAFNLSEVTAAAD